MRWPWNRLKSKTDPPRYLRVKNDILLLYLKGIRGLFENKRKYPYNFFNHIMIVCAAIYGYKWLTNQFQNELERHNQPNILIPQFIYRARREHYIYWELSRLARGKSTTFTYFDWDTETESTYFNNRDGTQRFEKFSLTRERADIIDNPLFESIFKKNIFDKEVIAYGNKLIAYHLTIKNRYNLDNYLHYKPITIFDLQRAFYYKIMLFFGLSNRYKYDHFIYKEDVLYDFEKLRLGLNLAGRNQDKMSDNYLGLFQYINSFLLKFL